VVDRADRVYRLLDRPLCRANLLADLIGRLAGLLGELLDLLRHHGEAAPGLARACRLNRGVHSRASRSAISGSMLRRTTPKTALLAKMATTSRKRELLQVTCLCRQTGFQNRF
jgi:hypothetical protein